MRFTNAYSASALCSPTRASILTGRHPARLRFSAASGNRATRLEEPTLVASAPPDVKVLWAQSRTQLPLEEVTIAEALRPAGYATGFIGKWHLGRKPYWPENQGFQRNLGGTHRAGLPSYFSPYGIATLPDGTPGEYLTDRLTDEAIRFIEEQHQGPFLLHLWHYATHSPWGHKEEITRKYRDLKDPRGLQRNPVMASMLESVDDSLGRLLDTLESLQIEDRTIVIFTSDNGGNHRSTLNGLPLTSNAPLREGKGSIYEGGTRVPLIIRWPEVVEAHSTSSALVSSMDLFPTMLDMAGVDAPSDRVIDGLSLVPLLKSNAPLHREAIFNHAPNLGSYHDPSTSVRQGDYKLICFYGEGPSGANRYELYDLARDVSETNDLASEMPQKVKEMSALMDSLLDRTSALVPIPNPAYRPGSKPSSKAERRRMELSP
jgi:arylsulfatase A-like enzyme